MKLFQLTKDDILFLDNQDYKFIRDFKKKVPKLGIVPHREFKNVDTGHKQWFITDFELIKEDNGWRIH